MELGYEQLLIDTQRDLVEEARNSLRVISRVLMHARMQKASDPKPRYILPDDHEIFGAPKEILSPDNSRLPIHIIDEVYGGTNELSFDGDFALPVYPLKVTVETILQENEEELELEKFKNEYQKLSKNWIGLRLKGPGPVSNLRETKTRLDSSLVMKPREFQIECFRLFAESIGGTVETGSRLPPKELRARMAYIDRPDQNDSFFHILTNKGENNINYETCFFLKVMLDLDGNRERVKRFEEYLINPANNSRLVVDGLIDSPALYPLYAEWLVQEYTPTEQS